MPSSLIEKSNHIVLIAHENPDADSLGSASAFYSYLLRTQKKITFYCSSPTIAPHLSFIPWTDKISNRFPLDADLAISFDCGSFGRLGVDYMGELINFDHHISNDQYGTLNYIDTSAMSTTQVVYEWFIGQDIKINGKMANALYAGLMDDTKCFRDPRCTLKIFSMAHRLLELGANHEECVNGLYNSKTLASLRLQAEMLKRMQLVLDGQLALFEVDQELLVFTGASLGDCKAVLDEAVTLKIVNTALLLAVRKKGGIGVSLRSDGVVNASEMMQRYGGGGHHDRAGAKVMDKPLEQIREEIISYIRQEIG
ncbi:MAG: bifunctional oligoribonuclease/PAP phosphatase NrnA [Sulfuricurvum sp.]|nr:bifunctional oligoribonuclease/PAP phosphatase NrnA [Sulfuricurvum sp.]